MAGSDSGEKWVYQRGFIAYDGLEIGNPKIDAKKFLKESSRLKLTKTKSWFKS